MLSITENMTSGAQRRTFGGLPLLVHPIAGEKITLIGTGRIPQSQMHCVTAILPDLNTVKVVEKKRDSTGITMTMQYRSMLCGFALHAITLDTRN